MPSDRQGPARLVGGQGEGIGAAPIVFAVDGEGESAVELAGDGIDLLAHLEGPEVGLDILHLGRLDARPGRFHRRSHGIALDQGHREPVADLGAFLQEEAVEVVPGPEAQIAPGVRASSTVENPVIQIGTFS